MDKLSRKDFNKLEKFVVTSGENYNKDRCLVVPITIDSINHSVKMCMDELEDEAKICRLDGNDIISKDELLITRIINKLKSDSDTATYTKEDEEIYKYFVEEIITTSECCEGNCTNCFNCKSNN